MSVSVVCVRRVVCVPLSCVYRECPLCVVMRTSGMDTLCVTVRDSVWVPVKCTLGLSIPSR